MLNFDHFTILSRTLNRRKPSKSMKNWLKHRIVNFSRKIYKKVLLFNYNFKFIIIM